MNGGRKLLSLWVLCLALLSGVDISYGNDIQLTDKDKADIIRTILFRENLLGRGLRLGEVRGIIYLSTENISPALVPRIRDVRFILLDPKDKDKWPKFGFSLFEFSPFEIEGSKVKISLRDSWSNDPNQFSRSDYEFTKRSGKWVGRKVGGGGGDSGSPFRAQPNNGMHPTRDTNHFINLNRAGGRVMPGVMLLPVLSEKKVMQKILWLFLAVILLGVGARSSYACTCSGSSMITKLHLIEGKLDVPNKGWLDGYSGVIFTGQVVNIKKVKVKLSGGDNWHNYQVTFKVDRYWKGDDSPEVAVFTGVGGGDCGLRFRKGASYIVFAEMIEDRLRTGICSFTAESRYEANIVKGLDLGDGRQPTKRPGKP